MRDHSESIEPVNSSEAMLAILRRYNWDMDQVARLLKLDKQLVLEHMIQLGLLASPLQVPSTSFGIDRRLIQLLLESRQKV
jgi:hypothetical protein